MNRWVFGIAAISVLGVIMWQYLSKAYPVLVNENSEVPFVAFNFTFRAGSAFDPVGKEGVAYLTSRLLRDGGVLAWKDQPARSRSEMEEYLYPSAARIGVWVDKEQVSFRALCAKSCSQLVFTALAQMLLAPAWTESDFERIKSETIDALTNRLPREDQEELGKDALDRVVYGEAHPYGHAIEGKLESVRGIGLEDIKAFYQIHYVQNRLVVGATGALQGEVKGSLSEVFEALPKGEAGDVVTLPEKPKGIHLVVVEGPFDSTGVHLGHPLNINRGTGEDFDKLFMANLGFGKHRSFIGRLMIRVREIRGLNYGTYSYVENFPKGGRYLIEPTQASRSRQLFSMWGRPTTLQNGCFLLRQMVRELEIFANKGYENQEFEQLKSHVQGNVPLLAMSLERQLGYAVDSQFYGVKGDYLERLQKSAKAATLSNINGLIREYLSPENLYAVVTTKDADKFISEIKNPTCPITYGAGVTKPKEVLEEDKVIANYKIPFASIKTVSAESVYQ